MTDLADLDEVDRRIIAALQVEGRRSFASIAEELRVPASSVRYRIKRLEDEGVLQVVGIANPLAIGFDRLALLGVRTAPGAIRRVCERLAELPETSYVVMTTGRFDILVEVVCRDVPHFIDVLENRIGTMEEVVATESFMVLEAHKLAYGWGVPGVESAPAEG